MTIAVDLMALLEARDAERVAAGDNPDAELIADRPILVELFHEGDLGAIEAAGFPVHGVVEGYATAMLPPAQLRSLSELASVLRLDVPRRATPLLNLSVPQIKADIAWPKGLAGKGKGSGAIIGIIDTGIDVRHPAFLKSDGTSRILRLWDQTFTFANVNVASPLASAAFDNDGAPLPYDIIDETGSTNIRNRTPAGFGIFLDYGIDFDQQQINSALANPPSTFPVALGSVRAGQNPYHGTASAGTAAGAPPNPPATVYSGVAPEADLIIVRSDMARAKISHAVDYIIAAARQAAPEKPVIISISAGSQTEPHNGFSPIAAHYDKIMTTNSKVLIVLAAGNHRDKHIHIADPIVADAIGETFILKVEKQQEKSIRIFGSYNAGAELHCEVRPPYPEEIVSQSGNWSLKKGSTASSSKEDKRHRIYLENFPSLAGDPDAHFVIAIARKDGVPTGDWTISISATRDDGNVHLWIEEKLEARFRNFSPLVGSAQDLKRSDDWIKGTVTAHASCHAPVAVGGYTAEASTFRIGPFSSQGPCPRDLSQGLYSAQSFDKPDLAAPGVAIDAAWPLEAPEKSVFPLNYWAIHGTSVAAPHVAGVAALIWSHRPNLNNFQVKDILMSTARGGAAGRDPLLARWRDGVGPVPGNPDVEKQLFGTGMVDADAAVTKALSQP